MNVLEVTDLHKSFKESVFSLEHHVLKGLDFSLAPGSITGFLGANGAGKTTLIKIILGFISVSRGSVQWSRSFGRDHQSIMANIGYFPERPYFYPHVTGREFLHYTGRLSGVSVRELKIRIKQYAELLKLDFALDRKISGYSKGMLQRLGFISAVVHNPQFLVFDEPLSGLDPIGRQEFKEVLLKLHSEGKTIFFSSHIVPDIEQVCEDVLFLDEGKIRYHDSIKKLLSEHSTGKYVVHCTHNHSGDQQRKEIDTYQAVVDLYNDSNYTVQSCVQKQPHLEEIIYRTRSEV